MTSVSTQKKYRTLPGRRKWGGKSTLIKILTGAYDRTSGTILLNGSDYEAHNPREAKQQGISTLFQELNVVDQLTVEENLTLGMEDTWFGFLKKTDKIKNMVNVLGSIDPSISPRQGYRV
jgi:ribose transport system ATP-binding protein